MLLGAPLGKCIGLKKDMKTVEMGSMRKEGTGRGVTGEDNGGSEEVNMVKMHYRNRKISTHNKLIIMYS